MTPWPITAFRYLLLVIAALLTIFAARPLQLWIELSSYSTCLGVLKDDPQILSRFAGGRGHQLIVSYTYTAGNESFTGTSYALPHSTFSSLERAKYAGNALPRPPVVYYDPANPRAAVLSPHPLPESLALSMAAIAAAMIISSVAIMLGRRPRKPLNLTPNIRQPAAFITTILIAIAGITWITTAPAASFTSSAWILALEAAMATFFVATLRPWFRRRRARPQRT